VRWVVISIFLAVLAGHFLYVTRDVSTAESNGPWAAYDFGQPAESRLTRYLTPGEYWLGLSYALAGAFAVFSFANAIRIRRAAASSSVGGIALSGVLSGSICFFTGCCGSPMLPVYLGLLGPGFLSITKPLTFGLTLLSIAIGYTWMLRRTRKAGAQ